mmetsp:Transcript_22168/g.71691  ORF Transcript_22168/g.71691 Transcript_22168/m.71691 type:complete len:408 (+) Transcript_22168:1400-2623(+)
MPMALQERVQGAADIHLGIRVGDGQLNRVAVVRERDSALLSPVELDRSARFPEARAGGQVDGALHLTRGAHAVRDTDLRGPDLRAVRIPLCLCAAPDIALEDGLRRPVVASRIRPAHSELELVQLPLRHGGCAHQRVPIHGLRAGRGREGSEVGPVLGQIHARVDLVQVYGAGEARGVREGGQAALVRAAGQVVLEQAQELVSDIPDLVEDAQDAVALRGGTVLCVDAMGNHRHLLAADRMLGAPVPVALHQRVLAVGGLHARATATDVDLDRVVVVEELNGLDAPRHSECWAALLVDALRQVNRALHAAGRAERMTLLPHGGVPIAGCVGVPLGGLPHGGTRGFGGCGQAVGTDHREGDLAALDDATLERLRRPEVGLVPDGVDKLVKLSLRHAVLVHERVPVHDL